MAGEDFWSTPNLPDLSYQDTYRYSLCEPLELCLWKDSFYRTPHVESGPVLWLVREPGNAQGGGQIGGVFF